MAATNDPPETTAAAVQLAHHAVVELAARDAEERAARVARLMRWTAGDRAIAEAAEAAASIGVER